MAGHIGKTELINLIQTEYDRLKSTLANLTDEQMLLPGVSEDWSVKDVLAHLTFWQKHSLEELQQALRGEPHQSFTLLPGEDWPAALDRINAQTFIENKPRPLAEINTEFEQSYLELMNVLNSLSEEDFQPNSKLEQVLEGEPVYQAVGSNTYEHYAEHEAAIRDWLDKVVSN